MSMSIVVMRKVNVEMEVFVATPMPGTPEVRGARDLEATRRMEGVWKELLRSPRAAARLFAALHAWRAAIVRRRLRFQTGANAGDALTVAFFEQELPLHLAVVSLDPEVAASFQLLRYIYLRLPGSSDLLDVKKRSMLFYGINHRWGIEHLEWLADKSLSTIMETDVEGLSITFHAVQSGCTQEFVIRLAVAMARCCVSHIDNLVHGRHFQSAKRYCQRSLLVYFPGVSKFPHAQSRLTLTSSFSDDEVVATVQRLWGDFVDKWGHDDVPLIQEDLPKVLRVPIESYVEVSIVAKGEPLSFQWYYEDTPIEGATLPLLYLAHSVRMHNAGAYHCEVVNRKGRTMSTRMKLEVVNDTEKPDPTAAFRVDKSLLDFHNDTWDNVKASAGACIQNLPLGVVLLLPPESFHCKDSNGLDVSNSFGVDIAIRKVPQSGFSSPQLEIQNGDFLVSCVIDVLPHTVGALLRPVTLWIPHCLAVTDRFYRPVIVEIDSETGKCKELESAACSFRTTRPGVMCSRISKLGRFAIVARKLQGNLELEAPLEQLRLIVVRPKKISVASVNRQGIPCASLWLVKDRPDMLSLWERSCKQDEQGLSCEVDQFVLQARANHIVTVQLGSTSMIMHQWSSSDVSCGFAGIASSLHLPIKDTLGDQVSGSNPFIAVQLLVSTRKLSHTMGLKNKKVQLSADTLGEISIPVNEWQWSIVLPMDFDDCSVIPAPTPKLISRTSSLIELDVEPSEQAIRTDSGVNGCKPNQEDCQSPASVYYYIVELANFSSSFWSRYDQTWWFDKTKTKTIEGMYRVVHRGYNRFVFIPTTAFAGCVRVTKCSIDHFGKYSEPVLIEPFKSDHSGESINREYSAEQETSKTRIQEAVQACYTSDEEFRKVFSLKMEPDQICRSLDEMRTSIRSANYDLALLLLGLSNIREQIASIRVAKLWFMQELSVVLALERFVPELDRSPVRYAPIILEMHCIVQDVSTLVSKLSTRGWLQLVLMENWFNKEVTEIQQRVMNLLTVSDCTIQGSQSLRTIIESKEGPIARFPWELPIVQRYLLLIIDQCSDTNFSKHPEQQQITLQALSKAISCHLDDLNQELQTDAFKLALEELKQSRSFSQHLLWFSPKDREVCSQIPRSITLHLDEMITGLTDSGIVHAIKVVNLSKDWATVQGSISFSRECATLTFTPSIVFEKGCKYKVIVKPHELMTSLGAALPKTDEGFVFHFTIPS